MRKTLMASACCGILALTACAPASTPQQQAQRQHDLACFSGSVGGALIGGAIGNRFGGGSGRTLATAAGASAGIVAGANYAC